MWSQLLPFLFCESLWKYCCLEQKQFADQINLITNSIGKYCNILLNTSAKKFMFSSVSVTLLVSLLVCQQAAFPQSLDGGSQNRLCKHYVAGIYECIQFDADSNKNVHVGYLIIFFSKSGFSSVSVSNRGRNLRLPTMCSWNNGDSEREQQW